MKPLLFIRDSASLAAQWTAAAEAALPGFDVTTTLSELDIPRVEVALVWKPKVGFLASLPNLKLVVSVGAGVDHIVLHDTAYPHHVPLVRMVDPGLSQGMCDYVAWACLSVLRRAAHHRAEQAAKRWMTEPLPTADSCFVAVMGLGEIGRPVAQTLKALGFQVLGWSRSIKTLEGISTYAGAQGLGQVMAKADIVVNLLPNTPATAHMYQDTLFAQFKPGAAFINAGRGASVDEAALHRALQSGQVGEAFVDVFQTEPLPAESPLWDHPKVTLTPHNAAITYPSSGIRALLRALEEMQAGRPLSNQVDWAQGY